MDEENLKDYMSQLEQVTAALAAAPDNEELRHLASSLTELITLTQQHSALPGQRSTQPAGQDRAGSRNGGQESTSSTGMDGGGASASFDDEMALFKMEIAAVEREQHSGSSACGNPATDGTASPLPPGDDSANSSQRRQHTAELKSSLEGLVGTRCSAPFTQSWGQLEHHAAVIEAVDDASLETATSPQDVMLRVLFSHPTQRVMQPCKYYLRHACDYGEECRFSHGHLVSVADIREYSESGAELTPGRAVLVPRDAESGLWQRAVVHELQPEAEEAAVRVTGHRQLRRVPLSELVPLPGEAGAETPGDDVTSSDSDEEDGRPALGSGTPSEPEPEPELAEFCPRLTWDGTLSSTAQLGAWEKYTKGVGSRLLRQMGYVVGTGLGPQADGRVEPVEARVYPAGRSLDDI